jgi:putative acetyltransferase
MVIADYDEVYALWQNTEGMGLNDSDQRAGIEAYLKRNPGLSTVAVARDRMVGAVLSGHDGRRGYLHHLAVEKAFRGQGIGRALVNTCLERLRECGIPKGNLFLFADNLAGRAFWIHEGWNVRNDLVVIQKTTDALD